MDLEQLNDNVAYAAQRIAGIEHAMINAGITSEYGGVTNTFYDVRNEILRLDARLSMLERRLTRDLIREVVDRYKRYEDDKDLTGMTEKEFVDSLIELLGGDCH